MSDIPPGLRTDDPPKDGSQIVAWAIDQHGLGFGKPSPDPRWCVVQFSCDYPGGQPYWRWSVPGMSTRVVVLGWLPLPGLDNYGKVALDGHCDLPPGYSDGEYADPAKPASEQDDEMVEF